MIDWNDIFAKSMATLIVAACTWLFQSVKEIKDNNSKLKCDLNAAFKKIRSLENGGIDATGRSEEARD